MGISVRQGRWQGHARLEAAADEEGEAGAAGIEWHCTGQSNRSIHVSIWSMWIDLVRSLVDVLSSGIGSGLAVVIATLLLRTAILPVSWSIAYRGCIRQKKMTRLQPELQRIKERFAARPDLYM